VIAETEVEAEGIAPLTLDIADSAEQLAGELNSARLLVMLVAGIVTLTITLIALGLFNRCTLQPMRRLTARMRLVRNDRSYLGTQVEPVGNAEMRELAEDFNELSAELKELHQTLESLAYNDPLTGLPNRVLFGDRLEQQVRLSERDSSGFAVLAIDLDHFKEINDTLGHHAGDQLLQQVGHRMKRALRRSDTLAFAGQTVARLGGDEFCALLPAVRSSEEAAIVAEKLLTAMEEPFEIDGRAVRMGMSIGIALYPEHSLAANLLCRHADSAMYLAKRSGTGYALFVPPAITPSAP
jgi:diguanylate cyclase (GGDEF)-like protein